MLLLDFVVQPLEEKRMQPTGLLVAVTSKSSSDSLFKRGVPPKAAFRTPNIHFTGPWFGSLGSKPATNGDCRCESRYGKVPERRRYVKRPGRAVFEETKRKPTSCGDRQFDPA